MKTFIITLLVGIILALFSFYLNNNKPEIVYTTSENIASFDESKLNTKSNIQQITVKNIGSSPAKHIQIKIEGDVLDNVVIKDSASDKIELHKKNFELIYAELPPDGSFKLIIKSNLNKLNDNVLTVKSSDGFAKNGLGNTKSSMSFFYYLIPLLYLIFAVYSVREILLSRKVRIYSLPNLEPVNFVNNKKPFYFTEKYWKELLMIFIQEKIRSDLDFIPKELNELNSYFILINKKPGYFSDEEWERITKKAKKNITLNIKNVFIKVNYDDRLISILNSYGDSKNQLPDNFRSELLVLISNSFISYKKHKYYINTEDLNNALSEEKPSFVKFDDWKIYIDYLEKLQFVFILNDISKSYRDPIKVFKKYEKSLDSNKHELEEFTYNIEFNKYLLKNLKRISFYVPPEFSSKPYWMKDSDYNELQEIADVFNTVKREKEEIKTYSEIISKLISDLELPELRPDFIPQYYWRDFKIYAENIKANESIRETLNEKENQLNKQESVLISKNKQTENLKKLIENQLKIINDLLKEPSSIYRIEKYSDPFASGNLENLKCLADFLSKQKQN